MFLFGFLGIFVITQMHGLGLSRRARWVIGIASLSAALAWYSGAWSEMLQVIFRIPVIEYLIAIILAGFIWIVQRVFARR